MSEEIEGSGGDSDEYFGLVPDSELDPPVGIDPVYYTVQDGGVVDVLPNDWVDLDESVSLDPLWGSSFQVLQCLEDYLTVKILSSADSREYVEIAISPELILNNYRRVPKVYE
jgi:hypothetical protein